jgi:hypothetical protein
VNGWPRGTLDEGSWWWARDPRPTEEADNRWTAQSAEAPSIAKQLATLEDQVEVARERFTMVEEVIDGYLAKARPAAAIDRALRAKFTFDVDTVDGHRLWLVTNPYWDEAYDDRLAQWLAEQAKRDASKHCALDDEAQQLVSYWTQDERLTAAEWSAVQAMLSRTPADERIASACTRAIDVRLRSDVPALDRLRWLAGLDCSSRRHPRLRAEAVRNFLSGSDHPFIDPRHRATLRKEFVACVGTDP